MDFFGRNAGQLQAAIGQARAAQAEHDAARVLLAANVVRTYVQWARLQDQHALAERALAQQQQMLQLARERTRAGLDNELAVRQNESSRADTRTQVAALEQQQQPPATRWRPCWASRACPPGCSRRAWRS
ncbi:TolC family protein [Ottowia pentelensis]|uniref:TolC family protein n=1 Tax=Ottowia pentelensis TaxID=511108 RepID=UPI00364364B5